MQPQIKMTFSWRRAAMKESLIAISKAVSAGFNTRERLIAALPQFSVYRLALALDVLITADMAENHLGVLSIHPDMERVFALAGSTLLLPIDIANVDAAVRRIMLNKLGAKNPAGVESLLYIRIEEA